MNVLAASTFALVAGALLLAHGLFGTRRPALAVRLARLERAATSHASPLRFGGDAYLPFVERVRERYEQELRRAGDNKTLRRFATGKLLLAFALPLVPTLPYAAATGTAPAPALLLVLCIGGFFLPDLVLRHESARRREAIFLDLPEAIAVLALALGAGKSLRQALELAGRDTPGPLGEELERALSLARRERGLDERQALVRAAREAGEPTFARFAELLAAKESPYLDFLRQQAREARAEQARYLERAADRAYLAMHAPLAPLLAVLVLLLAYGFLRFLAQTV
jgi:tight adherence protein C